MAKVKNRKKELKQELKRQGIIGQEHPKVISLDANTDITAIPTDAETVTITEKPSLAEFSETKELAGLRSDVLEGIYEEGVTSKEELKDMTEEELLAVKGVGPATVEKLADTVGIDGNLSFEEFSNLKEVKDIRSDLVEMLYHEGIKSKADFKQWTEQEVLDINGIGQGTIDKLVENGVTFKK
ncbi:hypothetical protein BOVMAS02_00280 [Streptococcus uberis]|uniref:helix-hairpin-helix domain-containing protein n=1 Tax=Streptococcus uberis TaxID=1349 RepID=UPI000300BB8B|nr:helix-hairpin-helix domain-containing protein [Streptococcus uberis]MCK1228338.1 helix-hairpin-helix domain-containing protein [Streptococcus uberis]